MKRLLCLIIAIFALIPLSYVNAGVTDGGSGESKIIRKTTTNYHTTIVFKGTFNGEEFTKTSSEIAANYNESKVKTELDKIKKEFKAWAEAKGANKFSYDNVTITDYYYDAHDEITQEKGNDNNDNSDVILVGDPNDMDHAYTQAGNVIINTILDKHQNFEVIGTATFEEVETTGQNVDAPSSTQNNTIYYIIGAIILVILVVSGVILVNKKNKKQK